MKCQRLIDFFDRYWGRDFLNEWQKKDEYGANGLQLRGSEEIKKVALGVSLNQDFFHHALKWGADTCVFHHGLETQFPHNLAPGFLQERLRTIFLNDLNIFGYHGAMDAHPERGHNALILKSLKAEISGTIIDGWGSIGVLAKKEKLIDLGKRCQQLFNHEIFVVGEPEKEIKRIAVCSGSGIPHLPEIMDLVEEKIDLYISGVISESTPFRFSESKMAYFAGGHYATEKIGVLELEKNLKKAFPKLRVKFIDVNNEL